MSMTTSAALAGLRAKAKGSEGTSIILSAPPCAGQCGAVGLRRVGEIGDLALRHHRDAVGELQDFVEVLGDQQHRGAAVALFDDLGANIGDGGEIEAEAGIGDDQHVDGAGEFAGEHRALHVAAGEVADRRVGRNGLDAVALMSSRAFARIGPGFSHQPSEAIGGLSK